MDYNKIYAEMIRNYINGNLKDFRKALKILSKASLLEFVCYCIKFNHSELDGLDAFEILKQYEII